MSVLALGLNHTTAALDLRGKFAFAADNISSTLHQFSKHIQTHLPLTGECALLSTCNRTELYCTVDAAAWQGTPAFADSQSNAQNYAHMHTHLLNWLAQTGQVNVQMLREHTYFYADHLAAKHAFKVASGLDSMVLGEPQILGQLKQAVRQATEAGTLGRTLHQMFQRSFAVAKEVRSTTDIGAHSVSMAAAGVRLAAQLFENLGHTRVLFVGAGDMVELCATHFASKQPQFMAVANRTHARGEQLAQQLGAQAIQLADLPERLHEFDIVVTCTASTLPIIGLGAVERAIKARKHRPIFMLDLAVPRDIEAEVAQLPDAYVYTVDDLSELVQTSGHKRQAAVAQAEAIINTGVQSFVHWLNQRSQVPLIQALHSQAHTWREQELAKAHKLLERGQPIDDVLQMLSRGLTQKMLHGAMAELNHADQTQRQAAANLLQRLFLRSQNTHNTMPPDDDTDAWPEPMP